jgi:polyisoprenoid-binding protein YceI
MDRLRRVSITAGTYRLGPSDGTLSVRTRRTGAVAKAGHDLRLEVSAWEATLEVGEDTRLELTADGTSLRVREGTGGMQALDDGDMANIETTIDDEVLKRGAIAFRSTRAAQTPGGLSVEGDLTLLGATRPIAFDVAVADGTLTAAAIVKQTDFGIKPYSALFGALKVADEVTVELEARLSI